MGSVNKAIIIGNLGHDPDLKQLDSGRAVANFRIATTDRWRDAQGLMQERTDWHRIVVYGKSAEAVGEHLTKGRQVCVEGRIQTRKWQDKDGKDRYTTEIVAERVTFLGSKNSQRIEAEAGPDAAQEAAA